SNSMGLSASNRNIGWRLLQNLSLKVYRIGSPVARRAMALWGRPHARKPAGGGALKLALLFHFHFASGGSKYSHEAAKDARERWPTAASRHTVVPVFNRIRETWLCFVILRKCAEPS